MGGPSSAAPQDPGVFMPETDPALERRHKALTKRLYGPESDRRTPVWDEAGVKKLARRIERIEKEIAESHRRQELAWKRARGDLAWQPGTGSEAKTVQVVAYSRKKGVPHLDFQVVLKATKSTAVPEVNPERNLRRALERVHGPISGRQWVRLRRAAERAMKGDSAMTRNPEVR